MAAPTELPNNVFDFPSRKGSPTALIIAKNNDLGLPEPQWEDSSAVDTDSPPASALISGYAGFTVAEPQQERLPSLGPKTTLFPFIASSNACSPPEPNPGHGRYIHEERRQVAGESKVRICGEHRKSEAKCNHKRVHQPDSAQQRYLKDNENERMERLALGLPLPSGEVYLKNLTRTMEEFDAVMEGCPISVTPGRRTTDRTRKQEELVHAAGCKFEGSIDSEPPSCNFQGSIGSETPSLTSSSTLTNDSTNSINLPQDIGAMPIPPNTTHDQNSNAESVESSLKDDSSSFEMARLPYIHASDHEYLHSLVAKLRSKSDHHRDDVLLSLEGRDSPSEADAPAIPLHNRDGLRSLEAHLESESDYSCDDESLDLDDDESSSEAESLSTIRNDGHYQFSRSLLAELPSKQGVVQCARGEGSTSVGSSGSTPATNTLPSTNTSLSSRGGFQNRNATSNSNGNGHSDDDDERSSKPPRSTKSSRTPKTPEPRFRCILSALYPENHSSCIGKSFQRRHLWGHVKRDHVRCDHCGKWLANEKNPFRHLSEFIGKADAHEKKETDGIDKIDFIGLNTLRELDAIYEQKPKLSFEELWDKWWKVLSADPPGDPTLTSTIKLEISKLPEVWNLTMKIYEDGVSSGKFEAINDAQREGMKEANEKALKIYGHVVEKKEKRKLAARKRAKQDENDTGLKITEKPPTRSFTAGVTQNHAGGPNLLGFEREPHNLQQLQQPPDPNSGRAWNGPFQLHPSCFHPGAVEPHQGFNLIQTPFEGPSNDMDLGMDTVMTTQPHHASGSVSTSPYHAHSNSYDPPGSDSRQAVGLNQILLGASPNGFQMRQPNTEGFSDQNHSQGTAVGEERSSHNIRGLDSGSCYDGGPFLDFSGNPLQLVYNYLQDSETEE